MLDEDELENTLTELSSFAIYSETNLVCEECCVPLANYGYNSILVPNENDKFITRELCDLCKANIFGEDFSDDMSEYENIITVKRNEYSEKLLVQAILQLWECLNKRWQVLR